MSLVTMRRDSRFGQLYKGRAMVYDDRVMVLNTKGSVLFNGSRRLWTMLISHGLAAGGPPPLPAEALPAQR